MRIVAGTVKGRVLKAPRDARVIRPTADRVRETLFNVLGQSAEGLTVLDLFAGTGALALEALSRGASSAVLVDQGREAQTLCVENAKALGFEAQVELLKLPVEKAWPKLAGRQFDLVFADPPYALEVVTPVLQGIDGHRLLAPGGRAVLEHSKHETAPEALGGLYRYDERAFGETRVSLYAHR